MIASLASAVVAQAAGNTPSLLASIPAQPDGMPLPLQRLIQDGQDGRWDDHTLLQAGLIASGVENPRDLQDCLSKYARRRAHALELSRHAQSPSDRARKLFQFLHANLLTGHYREDFTELDRLLARGDFNCASATLLWTMLAGDCGLHCHVWETSTHTWSNVQLDGHDILIEATDPQGFDAQPRPRSAPARRVNPVGQVASILVNRSVNAMAARRYDQALSLSHAALLLDPHKDAAISTWRVAQNRHALALCDQKQFELAAANLNDARQRDPDYAPFRENLVYVLDRWLGDAVSRFQITAARKILSLARSYAPGDPLWTAWQTRIDALQTSLDPSVAP